MQPFGHNRYGQKIGGCVPLGERTWVIIYDNVARTKAYVHTKFHLDPSNRLATVLQRYRQDRQQSDSIGRTVLQTVAQKLPILLRNHVFAKFYLIWFDLILL